MFSPKSYVKVEMFISASDAFTLGISKLGTDKLSATGATWTDVTDSVVRVQTSTGYSLISGIYTQPQPGTLSLDLQSATLDPNFNARIRNGVNIRVSALTSPVRCIWYGRITSVYATYLHDGQNIVTIQATEPLDTAMNRTRTSSYPTESSDSRFTGLMTTLGFGSKYLLTGPFSATMAALPRDNRSTGDLLTEVVKAELGAIYWAADPGQTQDGYIIFEGRYELQNALSISSANYFFSDVHSTASTHSCYSSIDIGADLDRMTNRITATCDTQRTKTTTAATGTGTTSTLTVGSGHGFVAGDVVNVSGVVPGGYNGTYTLSSITSTTISYANDAIGAQTQAGTVGVDVNITQANTDQVQLYGSQNLDVTVSLDPSGSQLQTWVNVALNRPMPRTVRRIQARAVGPAGVFQNHVAASPNDVASIVKTIGTNTIDTKLLISNVSHTIDSDGWLMDIELWSGLS